MDSYTNQDVKNLVEEKTGKKVNIRMVQRLASDNDIGFMINPRLRMFNSDDKNRLVAMVEARVNRGRIY